MQDLNGVPLDITRQLDKDLYAGLNGVDPKPPADVAS
jgi:hypothetical protein